MKANPQFVARAAISGIRWNSIGGIATTALSLLIGAVLARILGPKPFGRALIATTVYGLVNLFTDGGFSLALIQRKHLTDTEIRRTFTLQSMIGLSMAAGILALAPGIAELFHDPGAIPVIRVMALLVAVQALGLTSLALLRREMRFKTIQQSNILGYLAGYLLLGVPLASFGAGVWSLVAAYIAQGCTTAALMYLAVQHPLQPSFGAPPKSMSSFGAKVTITNLVNWGQTNLDNIAVSNRLGPFALGLYGRVYSFSFAPSGLLVGSLQSVLLSSAAKAQERLETVGEMALLAISLILAILGPAFATFALIPDTVIRGVYGTKWMQAIPLATPLAMAVLLYSCMCMLGPILTGLGKPERELWPQAISCSFAAFAYFLAARHSLIALAWTVCAANLLRMVLLAINTFPLLRLDWSQVVFTFVRGLSFSAAFGASIWLVDLAIRSLTTQTEARLAIVFCISVIALACLLRFRTQWAFGKDKIAILQRYAPALPSWLAAHILSLDCANSISGANKSESAVPVEG